MDEKNAPKSIVSQSNTPQSIAPHNETVHRAFRPVGPYRWDGVEVKTYTATGTASNSINKQILFDADEKLCAELRYFEAEPGGYSALEKHDHVHAVLILRGRGKVLVGRELFSIGEHDLVYTPPRTWHQFYAAPDAPLGFLCLVNGERDRPVRPTEKEIQGFLEDPLLKDVVRY